MKILSVVVVPMEMIEVEPGPDGWTDYRRWGAANWEVLMGESWEPCYACEELEEAYQACWAAKEEEPICAS